MLLLGQFQHIEMGMLHSLAIGDDVMRHFMKETDLHNVFWTFKDYINIQWVTVDLNILLWWPMQDIPDLAQVNFNPRCSLSGLVTLSMIRAGVSCHCHWVTAHRAHRVTATLLKDNVALEFNQCICQYKPLYLLICADKKTFGC